ncbi:MAG: hypothetical protein JW837_13835 [Sedimentisphaerales bacterium]|nr:hypothetical protein [Sedimentisphaerales bacterium]
MMRRILFASILVCLVGQAAFANVLSNALDTDLVIATGGNKDWFVHQGSYFNDGDAARAGNITHNQETWMQTTINGAGTLSFSWAVSCEYNYDGLEFYIDGSLKDRISGEVGLHQMTYNIETAGLHTLEWRYVKDYNVSVGDDSSWMDQLEWSGDIETPAGPLSDALDTSLGFTTEGDAGWFAQTDVVFADGDAVQSGNIVDNQESLIRTTISGTGTFSFYWKVSSEAGYDFLEFYVDGFLQERISGILDWHRMEYEFVESGERILEWRYVKDYSESAGDDSGWIDFIEWSGTTSPPSAGPLSEALDTTISVITDGDQEWFSQTDVTFFDGDAAQSGAILDDQESSLHVTINGGGTLSFFWKVSSEIGYDFLEFYLDGVFQERISGSVDWQQMMYTISGSGEHTLDWRYTKDKSVSDGSDSGWIDQLEWSGETQPPSSSGPLANATDTNLSFTTSGDEDWFSQTVVSFFDGDAAQSGNVEDNQESLMAAQVIGTGTLKFYWKVSSEAGYDFLEYYIDGVLQDRISGSEDWHQMIYVITESGAHALEWRYVKDYSESKEDDAGWVDQVEWLGSSQPPTVGPLSDAMDTSLSFTTSGDEGWFSQTVMSYFDGDAAQSGIITDNQQSKLQTTVGGTGTISFYWKVSSEKNYDFLEFYIDGTLQDRISGTQDWQKAAYTITESGSHTLEWRYFKDWSESKDQDTGWVDQVEWSGAGQPPSGSTLSDALETSFSFTSGGDANWFLQTTVFYNDLDAAQSGIISHSQQSWMKTIVSGPTSVRFYWKVSSENGYDMLEFYVDDSLQGSISGSADWRQEDYALPAGQHELKWSYIKDWSVSEGDDSGWVDALVVD